MSNEQGAGGTEGLAASSGATLAEAVAVPEHMLDVPPVPAGVTATRSPTAIALARLRRDRGAIIGAVFIVFLVLVAVFAPLIVKALGHPPNAIPDDVTTVLTGTGLPKGSFGGISSDYLLGVEPSTGRDVFSRIVYGSRVSLLISLSATLMTIVLGTLAGSVAGFFPGAIDQAISRVMDLLLAFPGLLFIIVVIGAAPEDFSRPLLITLVLGGFGWPFIGRLVRTLVLSLREREFVEAARVSGASEWQIMVREVMPNLTGPLLTYATLIIPGYIVAEAGLSFLGVGIRVPDSSWGGMLADASSYYTADVTFLAVPGLALFLTVFAFNLVGDGVNEAFNPKSRR